MQKNSIVEKFSREFLQARKGQPQPSAQAPEKQAPPPWRFDKSIDDYVPGSSTPEYISEKQAAALVGLSIFTLQAWRSKRYKDFAGPPYVKLPGGTIRYHVKTLLSWFAQYSQNNGEPPSVA